MSRVASACFSSPDSKLRHQPVMLAEALAALNVCEGGTYIDATFGAGNYTTAILQAGAGKVIALDRDPFAIREGAAIADRFSGSITLLCERFSNMAEVARTHAPDGVNGIVFDVGVSSMQLNHGERGFSFMREGPLDMRMGGDAEISTPPAKQIIAEESAAKLTQLFHDFGDEPHAARIARAIVKERTLNPINTTRQLAKIIEQIVPKGKRSDIHPATRVFQALRIAVNEELEEITRALAACETVLRPGGRLVVVCFHSLEDRIVKRYLRDRSVPPARPTRHLPEPDCKPFIAKFKLINTSPSVPGADEVKMNKRARSARMRVGERLPEVEVT